MQTNSIKNLITTLFYATNNNTTCYVKHKNKIKVIKYNYNLTHTYKTLYKHYKCSLKTLNTIQFLYANNNLQQTVKYYKSFAIYSKVCKCNVASNCINNTKLTNILQNM